MCLVTRLSPTLFNRATILGIGMLPPLRLAGLRSRRFTCHRGQHRIDATADQHESGFVIPDDGHGLTGDRRQ
jgi:hypothetical protein